MQVKTNMGRYDAVWESIWELSYKNRQNVGSLDSGEYQLYKALSDANSSVLKIEKYTSLSPYPKFFINEKYIFPEFKLENINRIRFLKVDSYEKYLNINTKEKTLVSHLDDWNTKEMIGELYNAVSKRDNKAKQYPEFEDYPKLGFLEWGCSENQNLQLLTELIKIDDIYYIIVQYGFEDKPRDLIQIDNDVAEYLLNNVKEQVLPG